VRLYLELAKVSDETWQNCRLAGNAGYIRRGRVKRRLQTQHYRHTDTETQTDRQTDRERERERERETTQCEYRSSV